MIISFEGNSGPDLRSRPAGVTSIVPVVLFVILALLALPIPALALSDEAKVDIATSQLVEALERGDSHKIIQMTSELAALHVEDIRLAFFEGRARFRLDEHREAKRLLEVYVDGVGRDGEFYSDAIKILGNLESSAQIETAHQPPTADQVSEKEPPLEFEGDCPVAPALLFDSISNAAEMKAFGGAVTSHVRICLYGENSPFVIQAKYFTGSKKIACANPKATHTQARTPAYAQEILDSSESVLIHPAVPSEKAGIVFGSTAGPQGLKIHMVLPDSPAERAGLRANDIIAAIDSRKRKVKTGDAAVKAIAAARSGVKLTIVRPSDANRTFDVRVTPAKFNEPIKLNVQNKATRSLSIGTIQAPYRSGGEEEFKDWIRPARALLAAFDALEIKCD